ncbi:MAG: pyridoxamine 5'-phosphate oxidase family protein [Kofleriaceae bacterium]
MPTEHELRAMPEQRGSLAGPGMSDIEVARDLVARADLATLSTLALRPAGFPYGSLVAFAADEHGRPLLLLSGLAEHTRNLAVCDKASLLVSEPFATDIVAAPRVTIVGTCTRVVAAELAATRTQYVARHPQAAGWFVDTLHAYQLFRLEPTELRLIVGFGRLSWLTFDEYSRGR